MYSIVSVEEKYLTVFDGFECLLILWWGFRFVEIPMFYLVSSKISIHYLLKKKHTIKFQREKKKNLSTLNSSCNKCHEANSRNKREKGALVHTCMELYLGWNNYQSPKNISVVFVEPLVYFAFFETVITIILRHKALLLQ